MIFRSSKEVMGRQSSSKMTTGWINVLVVHHVQLKNYWSIDGGSQTRRYPMSKKNSTKWSYHKLITVWLWMDIIYIKFINIKFDKLGDTIDSPNTKNHLSTKYMPHTQTPRRKRRLWRVEELGYDPQEEGPWILYRRIPNSTTEWSTFVRWVLRRYLID